jgi:hypothetical protein
MKSWPFYQDIGAGDGTQTRDLYLGRVPLYQLSYARTCGNARYGTLPHWLRQ